MDGQTAGLIGGIAGGVIGTLGGVLGTYVSLKNAKGSKERSVVIRAAVIVWLGVTLFLACLFLLPFPVRFLPWLFYGPLLYWYIKTTNTKLEQAKIEDAACAKAP